MSEVDDLWGLHCLEGLCFVIVDRIKNYIRKLECVERKGEFEVGQKGCVIRQEAAGERGDINYTLHYKLA